MFNTKIGKRKNMYVLSINAYRFSKYTDFKHTFLDMLYNIVA